jgi:anti-sigma B factor antagonist
VISMKEKELSGERGGAHVDEHGIRPPRAYSVESLEAPAGVVLLALAGEFDLAAAPATRERFEAALAARPRAVVADMSDVTFMDSSALRELLRANAALGGAGIRFVLANPPLQVERVLELTRAQDLLTVAASVSAALELAAR